jgi:hypothetical protein
LSPSRPACDFAVLSPCPVLTAVLPPLWFISPISCMGCECPSGCCVILQSRFIRVTSNLFPSVLCRTTPTNVIYISTSPYSPVSGSHLVSAFSYHHYPVAVCSVSLILSCSRLIVCAYYFYAFGPFRCAHIFHPTFLLLCLYSPSTVVLP